MVGQLCLSFGDRAFVVDEFRRVEVAFFNSAFDLLVAARGEFQPVFFGKILATFCDPLPVGQ